MRVFFVIESRTLFMRVHFSLLSSALLVLSSAALAQEWAGTVKGVAGVVSVDRGGKTLPLALGDKVFPGDRLLSGAGGRIAVTLRDDTLISTGANSQVALKDFSFNPSTQDGNLMIAVLRGVTAMVSGLLAKTNPNAMQVTTPTATIGIRGTEFIVEVADE